MAGITNILLAQNNKGNRGCLLIFSYEGLERPSCIYIYIYIVYMYVLHLRIYVHMRLYVCMNVCNVVQGLIYKIMGKGVYLLAGPISKRYERNPYLAVHGLAWTWGGGGGLGLVFYKPGVKAYSFLAGPISKRYERNAYLQVQDLAWTWGRGLGNKSRPKSKTHVTL